MDQPIGAIIILSLLIAFPIILLCRIIFLWFWKINDQIDLQKERNELLEKIYRALNKKNAIAKSNLNFSDENFNNVTIDNNHNSDDFEISTRDIESCTFEEAKSKSEEYIENGTADWRVPNRDELYYVFDNKIHYPFIKNEKYWSSSKNDKNELFVLDFFLGDCSFVKKNTYNRAFFVRGKINN